MQMVTWGHTHTDAHRDTQMRAGNNYLILSYQQKSKQGTANQNKAHYRKCITAKLIIMNQNIAKITKFIMKIQCITDQKKAT